MEKGIRCISGLLTIISILLLLCSAWVIPYGDTKLALREIEEEYRLVEREMTSKETIEEIEYTLSYWHISLDKSVRNFISEAKKLVDMVIDGKVKPMEMAKISRVAIKSINTVKDEIEQNPYIRDRIDSEYIDSEYIEKLIDIIDKIKLWSIAYLICFIGAVLFGALVFICRLIGRGPRAGWIFFIFNIALVVLVFLLCKGLNDEAELNLKLTFFAYLTLVFSIPLPLKTISKAAGARRIPGSDVGISQIRSDDIEFRECEVCGAKNKIGNKFCGKCGAPFKN